MIISESASSNFNKMAGKAKGKINESSKIEMEEVGSFLDVNLDVDVSEPGSLLYGVNEVPPWPALTLLVAQNFFIMLSGLVGMPLLIAGIVCMDKDLTSYARLISSTFFIQGLVTFFQATFGIRLPVVQGASFVFIPVAFGMASSHEPCPTNNATIGDYSDVWRPRLDEVNGGLFMASLFQVILGATGLAGVILRFLGPLTIGSCIGLLGIGLIDVTWTQCSVHWGVSSATCLFVIIFSQYLRGLNVPCCSYTRKKRCHISRNKIFQLFSVLFSAILGCFLSFILTISGALPSDPSDKAYSARIDIGRDTVSNMPWFQFPSPVSNSLPKISIAASLGMLAAILASIVESIGDYNACAKLSNVCHPPDHAVNRGIFIEGVGCLISGLWGTGTGTGTYSGNIVAIGITRVASLRVTQGTALTLIFMSFFSKFTAVLASIPGPVVGGILASLVGMLVSVCLSILQKADTKSPRNVFIVGFSFFIGIACPSVLAKNPGLIITGIPRLDQILTILMSTGMFMGGLTAFFLDNTVPGTLKERGIEKRTSYTHIEDFKNNDVYDLPFFMNYIRGWHWTQFIPLCPTSRGICSGSVCSRRDGRQPA